MTTPAPRTRKCPSCGFQFVPDSYGQVFCSGICAGSPPVTTLLAEARRMAAAAGEAVLRAGVTCGFSFAYADEEYPEARHVARFTDDAGLHWQIDQTCTWRGSRSATGRPGIRCAPLPRPWTFAQVEWLM